MTGSLGGGLAAGGRAASRRLAAAAGLRGRRAGLGRICRPVMPAALADKPRTDSAARAFQAADRAYPFDRRSAGTAPSLRLGPCGDSIARSRFSVYRYHVIPGIVLAGGRSSRMGRPKALLTLGAGAETFFDRVTRTLLQGGAEEVVVVVGAGGDAIRARGWRRSPCTSDSSRTPIMSKGSCPPSLRDWVPSMRPAISGALVTLDRHAADRRPRPSRR